VESEPEPGSADSGGTAWGRRPAWATRATSPNSATWRAWARGPAARAIVAALPYPLLLVAGTVLLDARPAARRDAWLDRLSTDLANLADHPLRSLLLSAFVAEGDLVAWSVLALAGLAALGRRIGARRALTAAFAVHVLATLASQGLVAVRIGAGDLSASARVMSDVGPSYVVVGALVAAVAYGTLGGRVVGAVGFGVLSPSLFEGLLQLDVAAVGHLSSVVLAPLVTWPLARIHRD
jgi:hypothetical protein